TGAVKPADTYEAVNYTLRRVNEHSFFMSPAEVARWSGNDEAESDSDSTVSSIEFTQGHRIDEHIAYLTMPAVNSGNHAAMVRFADSLHHLIQRLDTKETTAWIVDLRQNMGGNCWPMLTGVGPVLGEGVCGYFMDRDGRNASPWNYEAGVSYEGGDTVMQVSGLPYELHHADPQIAVLTGPSTASSGEVVTVAFRAQPSTRSFGQPTAGYSTANTNIMMPDGGMLLLTISIYGDRDKNPYGAEVIPDVVVEGVTTETVDPTLEAALQWLRGGE
ncbi:MAG: S41 family peptidase, partial [Saprospiraceae bacterium]